MGEDTAAPGPADLETFCLGGHPVELWPKLHGQQHAAPGIEAERLLGGRHSGSAQDAADLESVVSLEPVIDVPAEQNRELGPGLTRALARTAQSVSGFAAPLHIGTT